MLSWVPIRQPGPATMLSSVVAYATYLIAAALMLGVFVFVYCRITPYDEVALIHRGNAAAIRYVA